MKKPPPRNTIPTEQIKLCVVIDARYVDESNYTKFSDTPEPTLMDEGRGPRPGSERTAVFESEKLKPDDANDNARDADGPASISTVTGTSSNLYRTLNSQSPPTPPAPACPSSANGIPDSDGDAAAASAAIDSTAAGAVSGGAGGAAGNATPDPDFSGGPSKVVRKPSVYVVPRSDCHEAVIGLPRSHFSTLSCADFASNPAGTSASRATRKPMPRTAMPRLKSPSYD